MIKKSTTHFLVVLTFLVGIFICLTTGLFIELSKQEKNHQQEMYEIRTELVETQDQLRKAIWHIEVLNKENRLKE